MENILQQLMNADCGLRDISYNIIVIPDYKGHQSEPKILPNIGMRLLSTGQIKNNLHFAKIRECPLYTG